MGHSRPYFLYFGLFYKQLTVNKCSIKVANDWIRTRVLWYRKQLLCQLRHNHCPRAQFVRMQSICSGQNCIAYGGRHSSVDPSVLAILRPQF